MVSEYNEYVREALSAAGDIVIKSMMGDFGYPDAERGSANSFLTVFSAFRRGKFESCHSD